MKVLIVDDDKVLADVLAFTLRREGHEIIQAHDGETALKRYREEQPDLIVLDVNLPRLDGFSVCQQIRSDSVTPIILLTVRNEEDDVVRGFELGADDYIPKPFSPRQLVARVHAVLRRAGMRPKKTRLTIGSICLDLQRREVTIRGGEPISLTPLEGRLLETLMNHSGQICTMENLIEILYGAKGGDRDMLRQVVHRLRSKIEPDPDQASLIETVPGVGYGLPDPSSRS